MSMPQFSRAPRLMLPSLACVALAAGCNRVADEGEEGFGDDIGDEVGEAPGSGGEVSESCWDEEVQPGELCQVQDPPQDAGIDPCSLSVADFDGDGRPDLAVPNSDWLLPAGSEHVTNVLRGYGDGSFAPTEAHDAGEELPVGLAVGDFDGDGDLDIATANNQANAAFLAFNDGQMGFGAAVGESVGTTASSIAAGDFDGDGRDDLVVTTSEGLALLRGGPGGAEWIGSLSVGEGVPMHAELVDIDLDGSLDLVTSVVNNLGSEGRVVVFHGAGDGSFPEQVEYAISSDPWWVTTGDLNMDGHLDLVVAGYGDDSISVLLGNSQGAFLAPTRIEVCGGPQSVAIGDMNNDGAEDIVVGCMGTNLIEMWIQAPGGEFERRRWWGTGSTPVSVQVADLNMDGVLDVAWANQYGNSVGTAMSHP
ncbi:VCBS repeat-containing protein [Pseudenhygromyxa sp. WMMC2535]|uniref:FG-GAP repeat domain-containing protein n=1 Tax=Pseudenhygromyxa sp. WMMC2535 TaxID=2712867 RepID=UPI0015577825|nr:FG-GAP-like repeat-containing protein [Pseudenhygromyxa sp. WMMC2535]NVB42499.1 VCBS repeat-containing protein [Pseudenhygromyxa sp. WMMC2535]